MRFVAAHRDQFGVESLCAVINLPVSTFYDRRSREPSARCRADGELAERIEKIWVDSGRTYGAPRMHAQLAPLAGCLPAPGLAEHHPPRHR